ncbi:ATP-grasp domain-containing protein [Cronbergia sp. UHCC 0137]|uniref:ATP-grasp domain-containing protein n=1 Tax=Cronbergia sp. UHCC 0137 TaxID=3110239 RepID=UPI002B21504A|nr:ATP-grasp domain-containing protein [Cronbergia sp. UHCC 0137]MEA5616286.1 ATP-grasp domain-containing protein [Cronbergia sp. UHCC 0137]
MDLLEYQVKEWFRMMGIPVLPSQRIDHPTDLKRLKICYPIVLKSQVHADERAKAGGVRIVETTIDAIAAAQNIFSLPIWGELPEVLLAECKYDAQEEFYFAVVLDTNLCRPVLLGCKELDSDGESAGEKMQYVVVEEEFSPFYARRLALKMGFQGALIQSISDVVEKMYQLFEQKDLDLVEINPLAVSPSGQIMALNGKVKVNERAINRHPEIAQIAAQVVNRHGNHQIKNILNDWDQPKMNGKIGILGNGRGSVLTTLDAVVDAGGKPGICLNLRHSFLTHPSPNNFSDRLEAGLKILVAEKSTEVILINFLGTIPQISKFPDAIAKLIQPDHTFLSNGSNGSKSKHRKHLPHFVFRLAGDEFNSAKKYLNTLKHQNKTLIVVENLDEAISEAVRLANID